MMRRILPSALTCSILALALPAAASAHHHAHRNATRARAHRRHHHRAHTVVFRSTPANTPGTTTPSSEPPAGGEQVATVASYEGGVLKLTLADNSTVSGKVTEATWIGCGCPGHEGQDDAGDDQGSQTGGQGQAGPGYWHEDDEWQSPDPAGGEGSPSPEGCGPSALVPGAKVAQAELTVTGAGAVWRSIELVRP